MPISWRHILVIVLNICLVLALDVPISAETDRDQRLVLDVIIQAALEENPRLSTAKYRWESALEKEPQVSSLDDPSFYTMFWAVPRTTPDPFEAREVWLGVKQKIPFPGKLSLRGKIASFEAQMAQLQYQAARQEIIRQVKSAYYELFLIHKAIEIRQKHLDLNRGFSKIAETKYTTGTVSQGDVLKALVEVSDLSKEVLVLVQRRRATEAKLNTLLNRLPQTPLGTPEECEAVKVTQTLEDLQKVALDNRPELEATQLAVQRSRTDQKLARKEYYPDFMIDVAYWNVQDNLNRWMLMVEAKIPLAFWSKGRHDARLKEAKIEERLSNSAYEDLKNHVLYEVEDALINVQVAESEIKLYRDVILPQAQQTLEAVTASYRTGRASFLNLIDSERVLLKFELAYYRSLVDFEKGLADLERAVGIDLNKI